MFYGANCRESRLGGIVQNSHFWYNSDLVFVAKFLKRVKEMVIGPISIDENFNMTIKLNWKVLLICCLSLTGLTAAFFLLKSLL